MPEKRKRVYSAYDAEYQARPKQVKKRVARNAARRVMKKKLGASAIRGKDIDHKRSLENGGTNAMSNLRVSSRSRNRARK